MRASIILCAALALLACARKPRQGKEISMVGDDETPDAPIRCGYDDLARSGHMPKPAVVEQNYGRRRDVTWSNLRVSVDFSYLVYQSDSNACWNTSTYVKGSDGSSYACDTSSTLTDAKAAYIKDTLMPIAVAWLNQAYKVIPVSGQLDLSPSTTCSMNSLLPVTMSQRVWNDTDLVIFVTGRPLSAGILAQAASCIRDTKGRALAGQINFNPVSLITTADKIKAVQVVKDYEQGRTAIHELHHVLGFNDATYDMFINPDTNVQLGKVETTMTRTLNGVAYSVPAINGTLAPATLQAAQLHFGCSTLQNIPLEDAGGSGTANSHWEKRSFMNEFITGSIGKNPQISNVTLALMHDSGWYRANFSMADDMLWGLDAGCDLVLKSCNPNADGFCNVQAASGCTWDRLSAGICNLEALSTELTPQDNNYNNSYLGGSDYLADNCPYVSPYATTDCRWTAGLTQSGYNFGGFGSLTSRCFMSSLVYSSGYRSFAGSCFPVLCVKSSSLYIRVNWNWYRCAPGSNISAANFNGTVICPTQAERDRYCDTEYDITWPTLDDINPKRGSSGTKVTITGSGFATGMTVNIGGYTLESVTVTSSTTLTAVVPSVKIDWTSLTSDATYVIVNTTEGYTAVELDSFTLQKGLLSDAFLSKILQWLKDNPIVIAIVALVILAIIAIAIFLVVRRNHARKQAIMDAEAARDAAVEKKLKARKARKAMGNKRVISPSEAPE